jgi:hypothetical protein
MTRVLGGGKDQENGKHQENGKYQDDKVMKGRRYWEAEALAGTRA